MLTHTVLRQGFIVGLALLLAVGSRVAFGQNDRLPAWGGGGSGFVGFGIFDVSDTEGLFSEDAEYESSSNFVIIGGDGYAEFNRWLIGGEGYSFFSQEETYTQNGTDYVADGGGGLGLFNVGYKVYQTQKLHIYPLLGFGGGGYGLEVAVEEDVDLQQLQEAPFRTMEVGTGFLAGQLSVGADYFFASEPDPEDGGYGGLYIGLRAGYLYALPSDAWNYQGGDINNGPDLNLNGFFVRLSVGGGGFGFGDQGR